MPSVGRRGPYSYKPNIVKGRELGIPCYPVGNGEQQGVVQEDRNASDNTRPVYLGIDVAGASNTWAAALSPGNDGLVVVYGPRLASLAEIVGYCEENNVVATAIDAQLTASLPEENGFRTCDMKLRGMIVQRQGSRNWVTSAAGLLAVPVRGRLLADHLSPR